MSAVPSRLPCTNMNLMLAFPPWLTRPVNYYSPVFLFDKGKLPGIINQFIVDITLQKLLQFYRIYNSFTSLLNKVENERRSWKGFDRKVCVEI